MTVILVCHYVSREDRTMLVQCASVVMRLNFVSARSLSSRPADAVVIGAQSGAGATGDRDNLTNAASF